MRSWSKCSNTAHEPACRYTPHSLLSSHATYHMLKVSRTAHDTRGTGGGIGRN